MEPARADDTTWTGANNDWFFTGNWDTGNIPTAADNVFINTDQGGNFPAVINANADAAGVYIGNTANGFLGISSAILNVANDLNIGPGGTSSLLLALSGSQVNIAGGLFLGGGANAGGYAGFSANSELNVGGGAYLGNVAGSLGGMTFQTGSQGHFTDALGLNVGWHGTGTLVVETGADVSTVNLSIGVSAGSIGTVSVDDSGSTLDVSQFLEVGQFGAGTLNINNSGLVTVSGGNAVFVGGGAGSSGTVNVSSNGFLSLGDSGIGLGVSGAGSLNISGGGLVGSSQFTLGFNATGTGTVTVSDNGSNLLSTGDGTVGFDGNGKLYIANGGLVSLDSGAGTLYVAKNAGSIGQVIIGDGDVPAGTLDAAMVQFGAGAGFLIFEHSDANYTFDTAISGLGTMYSYAGVTKLTGDASGFTGQTNVYGGSLYVNNILGGLTVVNDAGTLGGSGTLNQVALGAGGTIAPGNSIGILSVATLNIESGSTYEVELNDGGFSASVNNDTIGASGAVTINGGTVHVTPENGMDTGSTYTPGTYTILTSAVGITGAFDAVTDDFAFLDFTLEYPNINNVFLNSSLVTSFCLPGMTANQCATADGVFSLGAGSLLTAVVNLSDAEAPGALDQLSGEIHASARTALIEDSRFARDAAIDRLRQVSDGAALWGRAFGSVGHRDGDGNAAAMGRDLGGVFLGGDTPVAEGIRLGLMGGYSRSSFDVDGRASSGDADTWSVGAYAGGEWNAFSLKGGAAYSWHNVETERSVAFTGFSDDLSASYDARTAQVYGEAAYAFDAGPARFEPFANLAHVSLSTDSFAEAGGEAALTSPGDVASATFTTLGLRAETSVVLDEVDVTLSGMLGWRHGFGDTPTATLGFTAGGDAFTVAGVPIARDSLVVEAGFDVALGKNARLSLSYDGQFGSGLYDHSAKARFGIDF